MTKTLPAWLSYGLAVVLFIVAIGAALVVLSPSYHAPDTVQPPSIGTHLDPLHREEPPR